MDKRIVRSVFHRDGTKIKDKGSELWNGIIVDFTIGYFKH